MMQWIEQHFEKYKQAIEELEFKKLQQAIEMVHECFKNDRQVFIVGNGGSSSNSSHFAVDLGKGSSDIMEKLFERTNGLVTNDRHKRFRVTSLNDNVPWMMAIINDYCQEDVFWRQLENFARPDDLLICISVSGTSPNVVKAAKWAKTNYLKVLSMTNYSGGELIDYSNRTIKIESSHYAVVEDIQMMLLHAICYQIMEQFDFERAPTYDSVKALLGDKNE